eukprot:scaffold19172_cov129-Isochrysis_galbana.AAC.2
MAATRVNGGLPKVWQYPVEPVLRSSPSASPAPPPPAPIASCRPGVTRPLLPARVRSTSVTQMKWSFFLVQWNGSRASLVITAPEGLGATGGGAAGPHAFRASSLRARSSGGAGKLSMPSAKRKVSPVPKKAASLAAERDPTEVDPRCDSRSSDTYAPKTRRWESRMRRTHGPAPAADRRR